MKIVVLVKQVPDTWGERQLDTTTGWLDRRGSEAIIDEIGERSVEVALQHKDGDKSAEVVVLTMGPSPATDVLRKALAMGADSAIHVQDDALEGADLGWTAAALARAIGTGWDLVVTGNESTDGRGGVIPAMLAEHLGVPHLTSLDTVEISGGTVRGDRATEYGTVEAHASLPAVISITERSAEPRFPNFKGILSAKKKPLAVVTLADLGVELPAARSVVLTASRRPPRTAGRLVTDDGTAATQLADFLAAEHLI